MIGEEVLMHFFKNYTGRRLSSLEHVEPDGELLTKFRWVVDEKKPLNDPVTYIGRHKDFKKQDEILLPFADAEGNISHILAIIEFEFLGTG